MPAWEWVLKNPFRLEPISSKSFASAVKEAAALTGRAEPLAIEELATAVEQAPGGLAMASRALQQLWTSPGSDIHPAEPLTGALDEYLSALPDMQRKLAVSALSRLVQVQ
jgi:hypothetical protein